VPVRLGLTVNQLEQTGTKATVTLSDGSREVYDLVVGSDGLFSGMRKLLFPAAAAPAFTGQACWRLVIPRPPEIDQRHFYLGGPVKVGLTPVSPEEMYLFLLEHVPHNPWRDSLTQHQDLRNLLKPYGGILATIRDGLSAASNIIYRPLEGHLLRHDWWSGNAILIGDAGHATTPQLASGAGMAVEDGIVLADEIGRAASVAEAFRGFMRRRYERCRMVVENSLEIGRLEVSGAPAMEQTAVVERSLRALAAPI
jgi:2-polyprenyl-6-methoxyphenol hydroxylase-like FAD-dependent oxidoreductase